MVDINKNPPWFRTVSRCKYSNLPVSHPEIFVSSHPGSNYFVDMAKLGDQIILVKASGYVRSYEMSEALRFMGDYISKHFGQKIEIIYLEDYDDVEGADSKARKEYIEYYLRMRNVIIAAIMYNQPILFKISYNIAKKLHILNDQVYVIDTYEHAFALALKIINQRNAGNILGNESDSLPIKTEALSETIFRWVSAKSRNFMDRLTSRYRERITRKYSDELLKYLESINWHQDGIDAPVISDSADRSIRKVFDAVSYIKSDVDDLLREREAYEQVLRKSEAKYRQLVEHAEAGILEFDYQTNRIISANDSFLGIIGYSKEEIFSMNPVDLMTEDSKNIYLELLSQRLSGKILPTGNSYQFITKSGQRKWVLLNSNITYKEEQPQKADIVLIDITHLKEVENELIRYQERLKQLSIQLSKAEENQRRQLASQLHESVSQELFVAQLKLNVLEKVLNDPKHSRQLDEIKDQIVKSIREIKSITYDLSPTVLYDLGLKEAVEALSKSIEVNYCLTAKARFIGHLEDLDEEIKIIIYRVIKEIIHNVIKHARASSIAINIDNTNNRLCVDVIDNGVGFDTGRLSEGQYTDKGFGLFDIREKINHLGGHLSIHSTPGSGTRIGLVIPLKDSGYRTFRSTRAALNSPFFSGERVSGSTRKSRSAETRLSCNK